MGLDAALSTSRIAIDPKDPKRIVVATMDNLFVAASGTRSAPILRATARRISGPWARRSPSTSPARNTPARGFYA